MEVPLINIRNIGGESYKNWTAGCERREGACTTVLGMLNLTNLWDIQVYGGYGSLNASGSWSSEGIRLFFGKGCTYVLVCIGLLEGYFHEEHISESM